MTQSKPGLLLRTTQTTDSHQLHLDISKSSREISTESVRSATYIWRYEAKNDIYRQNAFHM